MSPGQVARRAVDVVCIVLLYIELSGSARGTTQPDDGEATNLLHSGFLSSIATEELQVHSVQLLDR